MRTDVEQVIKIENLKQNNPTQKIITERILDGLRVIGKESVRYVIYNGKKTAII